MPCSRLLVSRLCIIAAIQLCLLVLIVNPVKVPATWLQSPPKSWNGTANAGNVSQANVLGWSGTRCGPGAVLSRSSLRFDCRMPNRAEKPISPPFCDLILRAGPPPCGFYVGGSFKKPLRLLSLSELRQRRADGRAACASRWTYDGVQHNSMPRAAETGDQGLGFEVRPASCPSYRYFSSLEALSILHYASIGYNGYGIVVSGDSMMRQILLRLMFFLRGEELFAEHYFHFDALYIVYEDHDELALSFNCTHRALLAKYFPGYKVGSNMGASCDGVQPRERVLAILLFLWDPVVGEFREDPLLMQGPPLHLASYMYWWKERSDSVQDLTQYFRRVKSRRFDNATKVNRTRINYIYFTTPRLELVGPHVVPNDVRLKRNTLAWNALKSMQEEWDKVGAGKPPISLVDFAALADVRRLRRTGDLMHFMCTWNPSSPGEISRIIITHASCRDPMNLAVVQWTLHLLWTGL
ncbi:hypothetical protein TraAM80_04743 [Trypanosoma rangeli]|uniref:Uncharacterized protein n=1 Tax=Trypanosoma rangeli TaxID=5698 RepID=A0A422NHZ9_TRYRA|nr:uncharacterized protein TraAM80_04743 [Trypanosoma rangeli]RNF05096.1 hypothetical protein TraAM80_04743 [Trypanosoma rangeli]|eukprot:RNF05096.1 hypothetical protein TraAM80_04743 [Trypanosoma rangeli]